MPDTDEETPEVPEAPEPADTLGDAGKKALDSERKARRDAEAKLQEVSARLSELEDAGKSELERAQTALTAAEKSAADAMSKATRLEVAMSKGLTAAQAKRLVGSTMEELEADAEELLETFRPADGGADNNSGAPVPLSRQPAATQGGLDPEEPGEPSVEQMLADIPPL